MTATASGTAVGAELALEMYRRMTLHPRSSRSRRTSSTAARRCPASRTSTSARRRVAVGVCSALRRDDWITSTHRGHGHCLAKGAEPGRMFAELLGKEAGYCRGKGGSMHIADHENGNLGANAIVGGSAGIATGAAFSAKRRGTDQVAVCFFGEGALGQGLALRGDEHGLALEAAGDLRLREQPLQRVHALPRGDRRRRSSRAPRRSGIETREVDGQDVRAVYAATARARRARPRRRRARVPAREHLPLPRPPRRRRRPRLLPHEGGGAALARRARPARAARLVARAAATTPPAEELRRIEEEARSEIERGLAFALDAPFPDASEVTEDVYRLARRLPPLRSS